MNVSLREKKLILLDFDGTIADTVQVFVHVNNSHFKEYGTKFLTKEDVVRLKKMSDIEALRFLDINFIEFFLISRKFLKQIKAFMPSAPPFEGMLELLNKLYKAGKHCSIVSRNSVENIKTFLKHHNISHITQLESEGLFMRKHKLIKKLLKEHSLAAKECVLVGDRLSDFESAKKAGIDFIFVTWGYGSPTTEQKQELKNIATSVTELESMLIS